MFSPPLRWLLVILSLIWGGWLVLEGDWLIGLVFFILAVGMATGHWREGTVWLAFRAMSRDDLSLAEKRIEATPQTRFLSPQNRAYQSWILGAAALKNQQFDGAKTHFEEALAGRLRTENDRAIVHCILGEMAQGQGNAKAVKHHMREAKRLDSGRRLKSMIKRIEDTASQGFDDWSSLD